MPTFSRFQKGNLLFHIILFICGKIDGNHFSCLFLKQLASSPQLQSQIIILIGGWGTGGGGQDMQSFGLGYASAILSF